VGYPKLFPSPGEESNFDADYHCPWFNGDAGTLLQAFSKAASTLNGSISLAAQEAGVTFVPVANSLAGHELCTGNAWINDLGPINGLVASDAGHPTQQGQASIANEVGQSLGLLPGVSPNARTATPPTSSR